MGNQGIILTKGEKTEISFQKIFTKSIKKHNCTLETSARQGMAKPLAADD
jgi:hypothetical protein